MIKLKFLKYSAQVFSQNWVPSMYFTYVFDTEVQSLSVLIFLKQKLTGFWL